MGDGEKQDGTTYTTNVHSGRRPERTSRLGRLMTPIGQSQNRRSPRIGERRCVSLMFAGHHRVDAPGTASC